jgi:hypothetical protein
MPGEAFEFIVRAQAGDALSFASMYGQSNDSFFGTLDTGIAFYDEMGQPVSGDVSDQVFVWDAGTEVNEPLGTGPNQGGRQESPDAGLVENGTVELVGVTDEFPAATELIKVTLSPESMGLFRVRVENMTADAPVPTPISPIIYLVHTAEQAAPLYAAGTADRGLGLERLAENGNGENLASAIAGSAVMNVGVSPGVFVIHSAEQTAPFFNVGEVDRGLGLEGQAEDGSPVALSMALTGMDYKQVGIFNTPMGDTEAGALQPGEVFEFSFTASAGDYLSFVQMFGQSNDLFFATNENGIALFNGMGTPVAGSFTGLIQIWDAGTEVNQEPFVGSDQAPRQAEANTGEAEGGTVRPIYLVEDGFNYPSVFSAIRVTISNDAGMTTDMMMMGDNMMMEMPMAEATAEN